MLDIDPTTRRMMDETGHACPLDSMGMRNLVATVHNLMNRIDSAEQGHGDWREVSRKAHDVRRALAGVQGVRDEHSAALDGWRRP